MDINELIPGKAYIGTGGNRIIYFIYEKNFTVSERLYISYIMNYPISHGLVYTLANLAVLDLKFELL